MNDLKNYRFCIGPAGEKGEIGDFGHPGLDGYPVCFLKFKGNFKYSK